MSIALLTAIVLLALSALGYGMGRRRAMASAGGSIRNLHSLPHYYGWYIVMWCAIPALLVFVLWHVGQSHIVEALVLSELPAALRDLPPDRLGLVLNDIKNLAAGNIVSTAAGADVVAAARRVNELRLIGDAAALALVSLIAAAGLLIAIRRIHPRLMARNSVERVLSILMIACSAIAVLTTIGIILSLLFESIRFFGKVSPIEFLFGVSWSPQIALRADQVASSGAFGILPLLGGTMLITAIAMLVAVPIGLFAAIYLSEYANLKIRGIVKPVLEVLAGIPTVVYGFFAALTVAPAIRGAGESIGLDVASESALAAGLVMGVMIIPFISSLSDDVINAVPQALRDGSYALGSTRSEAIKRVILPAALPGIFAAVLLAVSRAIGETMIVVMAAGLAANLTINPLEAVTTITVQIVTLLVGDQEFDSAKTLAAFALGLVLFCATLAMNILALHVVRKYREQYE